METVQCVSQENLVIVKDVYPFICNKEKRKFEGGVSIYIVPLQLMITGCLLKKKKFGWFFIFPHFNNLNTITKKIVSVPFLSFANKDFGRRILEEAKSRAIVMAKKKFYFEGSQNIDTRKERRDALQEKKAKKKGKPRKIIAEKDGKD